MGARIEVPLRRHARFEGTDVDFWGAMFGGADINFDRAIVNKSNIYFNQAYFAYGKVDLTTTFINGGLLRFRDPKSWSKPPETSWSNEAPTFVDPTHWPPKPYEGNFDADTLQYKTEHVNILSCMT